MLDRKFIEAKITELQGKLALKSDENNIWYLRGVIDTYRNLLASIDKNNVENDTPSNFVIEGYNSHISNIIKDTLNIATKDFPSPYNKGKLVAREEHDKEAIIGLFDSIFEKYKM
jgi:hypothetical protein